MAKARDNSRGLSCYPFHILKKTLQTINAVGSRQQAGGVWSTLDLDKNIMAWLPECIFWSFRVWWVTINHSHQGCVEKSRFPSRLIICFLLSSPVNVFR